MRAGTVPVGCYRLTMPTRTDTWLRNLTDERDGAALYEGLAALESDPERAQSFRSLAAGERRHAEVWTRKLAEAGASIPADHPSSRIRVLLWLARRLGTSAVLPLVLENEGNDAEKYRQQGGEAEASALRAARDWPAVLRSVASLKPAVDAFFEGVLVMAEDPLLRRNRLGLMRRVGALFADVADFRRIQAEAPRA